MLPDDTDQMLQLLGGSFAAGFFLYRFQNGQIKCLGEIGEAIVEGYEIPTVEVG